MWNDGLPDSIAGLQMALRDGALTLDEACRLQRERFAIGAGRFGGVVRFMDEVCVADLPASGVGVAHKDIFWQQDHAPGFGRDRGQPQVGASMAHAPAALARHGMFQLGVVSMAEDASSAVAYTRNLPVPVNPLDPSLAVGGSSSGSAVVVAAGMAYLSLGTDTAGSVRIPAMTCGILGLKTTTGLIDRSGMQSLAPSLDTIGLLARHVDDLGVGLDGLAGTGMCLPVPTPLRLAYWDAFDDVGFYDRHIANIVHGFLESVAPRRSASLVTHFKRANHHVQIMMAAEVARSQALRLKTGQAAPQTHQLGLLGQTMPRRFYDDSVTLRAPALQSFLDEVMVDTDVLLMPLQLQPLPACDAVYPESPAFEAAASLALYRMSGWINYLGLPALAMPIARDEAGHPVSIQLVGRPRAERQLLAAAALLQAATAE